MTSEAIQIMSLLANSERLKAEEIRQKLGMSHTDTYATLAYLEAQGMARIVVTRKNKNCAHDRYWESA